MKRFFLISLLAALYSSALASDILFKNPFSTQKNSFNLEDKPKKEWKEKISFGGNVSANFGTVNFVLFNPMIVYRLNEETWIGAGPFLQYISQNFGAGRISSYIYGAAAFGRRFLTEDLFLQAEYDYLNFETGTGRDSRGFAMAGGGYQPIPNFSISVMYIFTRDPNGYIPFGGSPWVIRGGIFF